MTIKLIRVLGILGALLAQVALSAALGLLIYCFPIFGQDMKKQAALLGGGLFFLIEFRRFFEFLEKDREFWRKYEFDKSEQEQASENSKNKQG